MCNETFLNCLSVANRECCAADNYARAINTISVFPQGSRNGEIFELAVHDLETVRLRAPNGAIPAGAHNNSVRINVVKNGLACGRVRIINIQILPIRKNESSRTPRRRARAYPSDTDARIANGAGECVTLAGKLYYREASVRPSFEADSVA